MKGAFNILGVITFIAVGVLLALIHYDVGRQAAEIKRLQENTKEIVNWDSVISAREKIVLDSVGVVSESLKEAKKELHNENVKLRRHNEALEKRFRDLPIPNRPDF